MHLPALYLVVAASLVNSQLVAQNSIAPDLRECYMDPTFMNRNNLPPATMAVLIDIIQQIEDNPNVNMDLRQLSATLLHTYRQDGIEYHRPDSTLSSTANVIPYAPTFHSFYRHKLLLTRIIPNNYVVLANDTISRTLKCAIHSYLSTTVDARARNDEGACNQLAQLRSLRLPRHAMPSIRDDVEILDNKVLASANKNGHMRHNPNDDVEYNEFTRSERQVLGESQCPILGGVVSTFWGAVSAGNLIAGIAAGAELQRVSLTDLSRTSMGGYANIQQFVTSLYPATLTGDLAEAVLIQGTEMGARDIMIGAGGGWNSSQAKKYYMLQSRVNIEMTDPEIRGDIDGFVLGYSIPSILSTFSSLKLSQLLDMYYTARNGVFNTNLRACNRPQLSAQYITKENLATELYAFTAALDSNMPLRGTITGGLQDLTNAAVDNFLTYTTNNLHDVTCAATEMSSPEFRPKTNLYLVLDAAWQYEAVYPAISYILDQIEVGKFGSSVTLLSAFDGSVVINKTFSPAVFHSQYTITRHQSLLFGVNLDNIFTNVYSLMQEELNNETVHNYVGGSSTVLLILTASNLQNNFDVLQKATSLNETIPDLRVIFATSVNQYDNIWNLVRDVHNDIHTVSLVSNGLNVETSLSPLLHSINRVGRRIINPTCGSNWNSGALSGTRSFDDYLEPGYINFYSIHPNYFYQNNDNRRVRIVRNGGGTGSLIVCFSRFVPQPRQNQTGNPGSEDNAITCQTLTTGSGNVEINLQNACEGYYTVNSCPFYYISVQSVVATGSSAFSAVCTDYRLCRFPYNNRYQVQIQDFGCYSGAMQVASSILVIMLTLLGFWTQSM